MMKKIIRCPTCKQDLAEPPHPGLHNRDCTQCGQGLRWRVAQRRRRYIKARRIRELMVESGT